MPLTYRIYEDAGLLFIRGDGAITQPERMKAMGAWLADPAYERCVDALCDFTAAATTPSWADLWELISMLGDRSPSTGPRKLAIVAKKSITFGTALVFEDLVKVKAIPLAIRVFIDTEAAWQWLRPAHERPDHL